MKKIAPGGLSAEGGNPGWEPLVEPNPEGVEEKCSQRMAPIHHSLIRKANRLPVAGTACFDVIGL